MGMQMQIHNDAEVRDTNNTKIAYKVKFFGDSEDATKTYLIASKDVKHSGTADFESQVSKLRAAHDEEWKQKYPRWNRSFGTQGTQAHQHEQTWHITQALQLTLTLRHLHNVQDIPKNF